MLTTIPALYASSVDHVPLRSNIIRSNNHA